MSSGWQRPWIHAYICILAWAPLTQWDVNDGLLLADIGCQVSSDWWKNSVPLLKLFRPKQEGLIYWELSTRSYKRFPRKYADVRKYWVLLYRIKNIFVRLPVLFIEWTPKNCIHRRDLSPGQGAPVSLQSKMQICFGYILLLEAKKSKIIF
jgi:hypothetical protein